MLPQNCQNGRGYHNGSILPDTEQLTGDIYELCTIFIVELCMGGVRICINYKNSMTMSLYHTSWVGVYALEAFPSGLDNWKSFRLN